MQRFDELIGHFESGMTIVTTRAGGERAGCLVGFQTQCSLDPPRFIVCLSKANHTFRVGLRADRFAVHFPTEDDLAIAELFGTQSGDRVDKFARCAWRETEDGVPLLEDCPHRFVARRIALLDAGGDHVSVVVEPTHAECADPFRPLRLSQVKHFEPGHPSEERPHPPTERSREGPQRA